MKGSLAIYCWRRLGRRLWKKITIGLVKFDMTGKYPLEVLWWLLDKGSRVRRSGLRFKFGS